MERDRETAETPTRRRFLACGGTIVAAGALAGCLGGTDDEGSPANGTGTAPEATVDETGTDDSGTDDGTSTNQEADGYSVSLVPVGEVEFESVPKTWVGNNGSWADMGVALGLEPPKALWLTERYHTQYYDEIPGVSVDKSEMVSLYNESLDKELFYSLSGDVHVMDPNFLLNRFDTFSEADVEEIRTDVAPFFGNCSWAHHYPWHQDYRYYTLEEAFEKLAAAFRREDRYEATMAVREEFQANLAPVVPEPGDRPEVAVLWGVGDEPVEFYPYVIGGGTSFRHFRDLGVRDALASTDVEDFTSSRASIDLETVLQVDPEILMLRGYEAKSREEFEDTVVSFLRDHDTARALTAVQNGDVYRGGGLYQGPITNMVLTERTAERLYGHDRALFDRERVAEIVAGDL